MNTDNLGQHEDDKASQTVSDCSFAPAGLAPSLQTSPLHILAPPPHLPFGCRR